MKKHKRKIVYSTQGEYLDDDEVLERYNEDLQDEGKPPVDSFDDIPQRDVNWIREASDELSYVGFQESFNLYPQAKVTLIGIGTGRRWDGAGSCVKTYSGKFIDCIREFADKLDDFEVYLENQRVYFSGSHHDGGMLLELRLLKDEFADYCEVYLARKICKSANCMRYYTEPLYKDLKELNYL